MKRTIILSVAALLMFSLQSSGQMISDSIYVIAAHWAKGDSISYDCTTKKETVDRKGNSKVQNSTSERRIFKVIDETPDLYTLEVKYRDVYSSGLSLGLDIPAESLSEISESINIHFTTDKSGMLQEVTDLGDAVEAMTKVVSKAIKKVYAAEKKQFKALGFSEKALVEQVVSSFCTSETVYNACLEDVVPLLTYHGDSYQLGKTYSYEETFDNIYETASVTGKTISYVDPEKSDSTRAVIFSYTKIDSEKLMPAVREASVAALRATMSPELVDLVIAKFLESIEAKHMGAEMVQTTGTVIDLSTGWPLMWYLEREITISDDDGEEKLNLTKLVAVPQD